MTVIEAGPYELTKQNKDLFEKVTFCIMSDNIISKRVYNKEGEVTMWEELPMNDIGSAVSKLDALISQYKNDKYL